MLRRSFFNFIPAGLAFLTGKKTQPSPEILNFGPNKRFRILERDGENIIRYVEEIFYPSPTSPGGYKYTWYHNDQKSRLDGPAVIVKSGDEETEKWQIDAPSRRLIEEWYVDGKRHRLDGPAVIHVSETEAVYKDYRWFFEGIEVATAHHSLGCIARLDFYEGVRTDRNFERIIDWNLSLREVCAHAKNLKPTVFNQDPNAPFRILSKFT